MNGSASALRIGIAGLGGGARQMLAAMRKLDEIEDMRRRRHGYLRPRQVQR